MLYLLWTIINVGLFLYFIFICFKAVKSVKENLGGIAALVFSFGLISFTINTNNQDTSTEPYTNQTKKWSYQAETDTAKYDTRSVDIDVEDDLISQYSLYITYYKNQSDSSIKPLSAYSLVSGMVGGRRWKPTNIIVLNSEKPYTLKYSLEGEEQWTLLGMVIFTNSKSWNGEIELK